MIELPDLTRNRCSVCVCVGVCVCVCVCVVARNCCYESDDDDDVDDDNLISLLVRFVRILFVYIWCVVMFSWLVPIIWVIEFLEAILV